MRVKLGEPLHGGCATKCCANDENLNDDDDNKLNTKGGAYIEEIWKDVKGYEGLYKVSNAGRVKRLFREYYTGINHSGVQSVEESILTPKRNHDGYLSVRLSGVNGRKQYAVHRLVAQAFIPNPNDLPEVNHIDCVRDNNTADNLEWITHGDNVRYSIKNGRHFCTRNLFGKNNPNYGNHRLHEIYQNNPELAKEKLGRPGAQNGRCRRVAVYDLDHIFVREFRYIGECAEWLLSIGVGSGKVDSMRGRIRDRSKSGKPLGGYYFCLL